MREDWATALYHDKFRDLCVRLRSLLQGDPHIEDLIAKTKEVLNVRCAPACAPAPAPASRLTLLNGRTLAIPTCCALPDKAWWA